MLCCAVLPSEGQASFVCECCRFGRELRLGRAPPPAHVTGAVQRRHATGMQSECAARVRRVKVMHTPLPALPCASPPTHLICTHLASQPLSSLHDQYSFQAQTAAWLPKAHCCLSLNAPVGTQALAMAFLDPVAAQRLASARAPPARAAAVAVKHAARAPAPVAAAPYSGAVALGSSTNTHTATHPQALGIAHSHTCTQGCAACGAAARQGQGAQGCGAAAHVASQAALPAGAMVSRATVVMDNGTRVSKTLGVALREWGHLYPQAFQGQATFSDERLVHTQYGAVLRGPGTASFGAWLGPEVAGFPVLERQDAADARRYACMQRAVSEKGGAAICSLTVLKTAMLVQYMHACMYACIYGYIHASCVHAGRPWPMVLAWEAHTAVPTGTLWPAMMCLVPERMTWGAP